MSDTLAAGAPAVDRAHLVDPLDRRVSYGHWQAIIPLTAEDWRRLTACATALYDLVCEHDPDVPEALAAVAGAGLEGTLALLYAPFLTEFRCEQVEV